MRQLPKPAPVTPPAPERPTLRAVPEPPPAPAPGRPAPPVDPAAGRRVDLSVLALLAVPLLGVGTGLAIRASSSGGIALVLLAAGLAVTVLLALLTVRR